jgi:hypothetical protein
MLHTCSIMDSIHCKLNALWIKLNQSIVKLRYALLRAFSWRVHHCACAPCSLLCVRLWWCGGVFVGIRGDLNERNIMHPCVECVCDLLLAPCYGRSLVTF